MTTYRQGTRRRYFYYVCPKKGLEHNRSCKNKNHRAEPPEKKVSDVVTDLLHDPDRLMQQMDEWIRREREAVLDPEKDIETLKERLDSLALMRRSYQDQQAAGHMTLDELGERLSKLDAAREDIRGDIERTRNHREHVEELENARDWVLKTYSGLVLADLLLFPPEERRRIYKALELRVTVKADGSIEVRGNFEIQFFPAEEQIIDLLEGILYTPEEARRKPYSARLADLVAEDRGAGVMSAGTTSTCWGSSTRPRPQ